MLIFYENIDNIDSIVDTDVDIIVDIEKPDGIGSPTFVVDDFLGLFSHPSAFPTKDLGST